VNIDPKIHERLKELNAKLSIIEKQIHTTAVRLDTTLQYELKNGIEGLLDYNLSAKIECYNSEEALGVPLCILREYLYKISLPYDRGYFINDGINHNEFHHWENHPMKGEHHCWLFHCLYDHIHPDLTWEQIASIEHICVDIKPWYQYQYELTQINS
jgi:hypothetical protein